MALTLVVEDGTGLSNANSFASVAEADSYFDGHLYATDWTGATTATKEAALVMSTRIINSHFHFKGQQVGEDQALVFPRYGIYDRGGYLIVETELPSDLKDATAEFAKWLIADDRSAEPDTKGFKKLKVDTLELVPDVDDQPPLIPDIVKSLLNNIAYIRSSNSAKVSR